MKWLTRLGIAAAVFLIYWLSREMVQLGVTPADWPVLLFFSFGLAGIFVCGLLIGITITWNGRKQTVNRIGRVDQRVSRKG